MDTRQRAPRAAVSSREKPKSRAPSRAGHAVRRRTPAAKIRTEFVFYANPAMALVCMPDEAAGVYSLDAAAQIAGVHPEMLKYYCRLGLLGAGRKGTQSQPTFDERALEEVRRIGHYRRSLGVSRRALPLICELWREGARLQIELRFLRRS